MSVLVVLLVIASPGLVSLTAANALSAAQGELAATMVLARGEALKRGTQVGVAAAAPVAGGEFSGGWVVFVDSNANSQYDAGETVVRRQPALSSTIRVSTGNGTAAVAFTGRGFLASTTTYFELCRAGGSSSSQTPTPPDPQKHLNMQPVAVTLDSLPTDPVPAATGTARGYRLRLEPVGLTDVMEITTCS